MQVLPFYHEEKQILAGTLSVEFNLLNGGAVYDNVWAVMTISAMSGAETLDMYGKDIGNSAYRTAVLATQIDLKANDEDVVAQDLSGKGPLTVIKFTAAGIADAETVDIHLYAWNN
jgi:hypothetical protein